MIENQGEKEFPPGKPLICIHSAILGIPRGNRRGYKKSELIIKYSNIIDWQMPS
jgi:hypothetical protein